MACSVTNLLLVPLFLFMYSLFMSKSGASKILKIIVGIAIILISASFLYEFIDTIGLGIIQAKLDTGNASVQTSSGILSYLYTPKTFFGTGMLSLAFNEKSTDIGFVSFVLNLLVLIFYCYGMIRLFLSGNKYSQIVALGLFYFIAHGLKIGQMIYQFPLLVYILFVAHIFFVNNHKNNHEISY